MAAGASETVAAASRASPARTISGSTSRMMPGNVSWARDADVT